MRVLVVEDNYLVSEMMRLAVEEADFDVIGPVLSVEEGIKWAGMPGLSGALLDINLGGRQSFPLARILKANGVPVIFVSGHDRSILPQDLRTELLARKPILGSDLAQMARERFQASGTSAPSRAREARADLLRQRIEEAERRLATQRRRVEKLQVEGFDPQRLQLAWDLFEQMSAALDTMRRVKQSLERSQNAARQISLPPISDAMIDANDPKNLEHWANELRITPDHVRELVAEVGPSSRLVTKAIGQEAMFGPSRKSRAAG
jgi:DNA-binding NarL/FixJ family response regulator